MPGGSLVNRENKKLKNKLIIQSFLPLSILVMIKNTKIKIFVSFINFFRKLLAGKFSILLDLFMHENVWPFLLFIISAYGIISGCIAIWQFKEVQISGFTDAGEKVKIDEEITDSGITFFMTFVLPLIIGDVICINDFLVYIGMILMVIVLMKKTNLYYQNPVLTLFGYKLYKMKFVNPSLDECKDKQFIAICKEKLDENKIVKWKYISDDICLMYNKH